MLKNLLLIIFLIHFVAYSNEYSSHFNIANTHLKILKIDNNKIILYGDKGGVIRSSDAGETWKQNFSGTHSNIHKLINYQDRVYGVNSKNQLMVSDDFGDFWEFKAVEGIGEEDLIDLEVLDDLFIVASKSNQLFINSNINESWQEVSFPESDSILSIASYNDKLYVQFKDYSIKHSQMPFNEWVDLDLSSNLRMKKKSNQLYFYTDNKIVLMTDDGALVEHNLNVNFDAAIPNSNGFTLIDESIPNAEITVYSYNLETQQAIVLNSSNIKGLDRDFYQIVDFEDFGDYLLITNLGKTYLKWDKEKWHLLSYLNSITDSPPVPYDRNHFYSRTLNGVVRYSTDGGASMKLGNDFIRDTINGAPQENKIYNLLPLGNGELIMSFDFKANTKGSGAFSDNNGKNLKFITDNSIRGATFLYEYNDYVYYYDQIIFNGQHKTDLRIHRINKNTFDIDSIYNFSQYYELNNSFIYNNKFYFSITNGINLNDNPRKTEFYSSNLDFSNLSLINEINLKKINSTSLLSRFNDVNLLLRVRSIDSIAPFNESQYTYFVLNIEDNTLFEFEQNNINQFQFPNRNFTNSDTVMKYNIRIDTVFGIPVGTPVKTMLANANFDLDDKIFEYDIIDTLENVIFLKESLSGDFKYFDRSGFWMPIEKERLNLSIEKVNGGPPKIWTFSAFPNPVSDFVSITFYSALIPNINELKVEITNISTGIIDNIIEYDINISDDYHGRVDFDIGGYPPGAYIINLTMRDQSMSETIIKQ